MRECVCVYIRTPADTVPCTQLYRSSIGQHLLMLHTDKIVSMSTGVHTDIPENILLLVQ